MLNSRLCAQKNRKLRSGDYNQICVRLCAQIEFPTQTSLRLNEPERFCSSKVWAAVFTFNPYLLISINEFMISMIHLLISINELLISINELLISINEWLISINTSSSAVFIDINNSFIDINKGIIDINNSFIDINKYVDDAIFIDINK